MHAIDSRALLFAALLLAPVSIIESQASGQTGEVVQWHGEGGLNWYEVSDDFHRSNPLGIVSAEDIVEVVSRWGEQCEPGCTLDRNNDRRIDVQDLLHVMSGRPGPVYTIPEDRRLEEGCILVDASQPRGTFNSKLWPNGIVPFEYDDNMDFNMRFRWVAAVNRWQQAANLTFVLRTDEVNYIHVQDASFNLSDSIGMAGDGEQNIFIGNWNSFTVEHEIAHALGFYHEQSRADREDFVTIEDDNICSCCGSSGTNDCAPQFAIRSDAGPFGSGEYGPYDFDSVMHYGACAWTNCGACSSSNLSCRTITVNDPWDDDWQDNIGQRDHLSEMDVISMSMLYPENNWVFVDDSNGRGETGSFFEPWNTVNEGINDVPGGGQVIIQPGSYLTGVMGGKNMLLRAPVGGVVIR